MQETWARKVFFFFFFFLFAGAVAAASDSVFSKDTAAMPRPLPLASCDGSRWPRIGYDRNARALMPATLFQGRSIKLFGGELLPTARDVELVLGVLCCRRSCTTHYDCHRCRRAVREHAHMFGSVNHVSQSWLGRLFRLFWRPVARDVLFEAMRSLCSSIVLADVL